MTRSGLPHSDTSGSMLVSSSPKLFAGYHVLHRLSVPRHPPYALYILPCYLLSHGLVVYIILHLQTFVSPKRNIGARQYDSMIHTVSYYAYRTLFIIGILV